MSETTNLKLKKHDSPSTNEEQFDIENYLNGNWDKIDENVGEVNTNISNINSKNKEQDTNIEQLQENTETSNNKIEKLETELKEMQEDFYQNSIRGQASGEYIHVEDSSNCRAKIKISGNSEQETRSGKNLLKNTSTNTTVNGLTFTINEDKSVTVNGTATMLTDFSIGYVDFKANTKYMLSGTKNGDIGKWFLSIRGYGNDIGQGLLYESAENINKEVFIRVYSGVTCTNQTFKPMVEEGSTTTEYEQYGESPSLDYRSEIKCCGDNVNIFEATEDAFSGNGSIAYDKNENKYTIESNQTWYRSQLNVKQDINYTLSFELKTDENGISLNQLLRIDENTDGKELSNFANNITSTTEFKNYLLNFIPNTDTTLLNLRNIAGKKFYIRNIKLEKGKVASPYSPYGQGCINEVICNKNLSINSIAWKQQMKSCSYLDNILKYTANSAAWSGFNFILSEELVIGKQYTISFNNNSAYSINYNITSTKKGWQSDWDDSYVKNISCGANSSIKYTFTAKTNIVGILFICSTSSKADTNERIIGQIQLEEGSTATEQIEHKEQVYTIPTQQPFRAIGNVRDKFIKKNNKWYEHHPVIRKIFDGTEHWKKSSTYSGGFYINWSEFDRSGKHFSEFYCNYAKYVSTLAEYGNNIGVCFSDAACSIRTTDGSNINTVELWKAYLQAQYNAGTPVYVDYVLEEPQDIECTEEQSSVLEELSNARTYKNVTNIYSTDEISPILDLDYAKDLETLLNNTQALVLSNVSEGV